MATNYGLLTGEDAVSTGLGQAAGLMGSYTPAAYPKFTPSQAQAPSQQSYMNYTPNQPMAQVQTPNYKLNSTTPNWQNTALQKYGGATPQYQGLMGGDYAALQSALQRPGEISAQNAYNTANRDLTNTMGGRGLYGSSIMATQANEGLNREYMNALSTNAANAAAQRYGMQATDLQNQNTFGTNIYGQQMGENTALQGLASQQGLAANSFNQNTYNQQMAQNQQMNAYNMDASQLGMQQNQNVYQAGVSDAARQQDYNLAAQTYANQGTDAQRQWANQQALEQMQYQLASGQYSNEQQTAMINQYLALAGRGQVTAGQNQAANTATAGMNATTAAQQAAADAAQNAALMQGIGGLLGTAGSLYGASQGWFSPNYVPPS